ncbi:hypothetical protein SMICM304S_02126 [Streptomyces microflavus]
MGRKSRSSAGRSSACAAVGSAPDTPPWQWRTGSSPADSVEDTVNRVTSPSARRSTRSERGTPDTERGRRKTMSCRRTASLAVRLAAAAAHCRYMDPGAIPVPRT